MPFIYAAIFIVSLLYVASQSRRATQSVQPDQPTAPDAVDGKKLVRVYGTVWLENPSEAAMQLMGTEEIKV